MRLRPESFADHYSQARQFFISQTVVEQKHIAMALTFELSKVETLAIRERMISHLLNIDEGLAETVADKLGIKKLPKKADAAIAPRDDLPASDALSIIKNGPDSFKGRKVGVLVSDGCDGDLVEALRAALTAEGALMEIVAPKVGGVTAKDGTLHRGQADDRWRPVRPLRRSGRHRQRGGRSPARQGSRRARLRWPTPSPTASSSASSMPRSLCSTRPASNPTRASSILLRQTTSTASSKTAASCGSGPARRR